MITLQRTLLVYYTLLIFNLVLLSNIFYLSANALVDTNSGTISLDAGHSFLDFGDCNHIINYKFLVEEPGVTRDNAGKNFTFNEAWGNDITVTFYNVPHRYTPKDQYLKNIKDSTITGQISTRHISFGLPRYEDLPFFIEPVIISYEIKDLGEDCNMDEIVDNSTQNLGDNDRKLYSGSWEFLKEIYLGFILLWFVAGIVIGFVLYKDAENCGKNGFHWGIIGFLLTIAGLVIWLAIKSPKKPSNGGD
jgi:hypothetical protein